MAASARPLRILVVDDDPAMVGAITALVGTEGHQVITAYDGLTAVKRFREEHPDLVLLDLAMPGPDGFSVAGQMRAVGQAPILVVSGESGEAAKVRALGIGADDYLTKPFGLRELMSRIKALLRRAYGDLADAVGGRVIRHRDLLIDLDRRRVQRGDRRISLTPTEFEILRHLASKPGRVYTRAELLDLLRDYEALDQDEKTINVHVSHLRDKLEDDPSQPAFVQTIRGVGYAFAER
jgi:two-component system alkaline phosphatase synthesis response regulator PhoP